MNLKNKIQFLKLLDGHFGRSSRVKMPRRKALIEKGHFKVLLLFESFGKMQKVCFQDNVPQNEQFDGFIIFGELQDRGIDQLISA